MRVFETVPALLRGQAAASPDAPALVDDAGELSFAELAAAVAGVAERLRAAGIGPRTMVALAARRSTRALVAMLAVLEADAICVPLDPAYPAERLRFMLADSQAAVVLCDEPVDGTWEGTPALMLDGRGEIRGGWNAPTPRALDADIAWVYYTSGSTGRPKGVLIPHAMAIARALREPIAWHPGERCCVKSSLSFMDSVWELLGPLLNGCSTVVADDEMARDPRLLSRAIERHGVTRILTVPSLLASLLSLPPEDRARLRHIRWWIASGEVLPPPLAEQFYAVVPTATLVNVYGATECWDACWHAVPRETRADEAIPIGSHLLADVRLRLLGEDLETVAHGTPGELVVSGPCVARGYLDRPELTAERFVSLAHLGEDAHPAYRTGDFALKRPDGTIQLLGRRDRQVKLHGYRIELEEVERAVHAAPGVAEAAVVATRDASGRVDGLTAFVVPAPGQALDAEALKRALAERLPDYCVPRAWAQLASLPLSPNGKPDRDALVALAARRPTALEAADAASQHVAPRSEHERTLAEIWQELLGRERIGVTDNFFSLGGTSLLAVQVVIRVQERFATEIPLRRFYEEPTIAALTDLIPA